MFGITQNLLSTYYGFGQRVDAAKTLSVHDCANVLNDDTNISSVDESLENETDTSTKESSKEEDTIEHYEDGFSTFDEKSTIEDEEVFEEDDLLDEYVDVLESLREQNDSKNFKTESHFHEDNFEKLNINENENTENSIEISSLPKKENEDQKPDGQLSSCEEFSTKKRPSCNGVILDLSGSGIHFFPEDMIIQFRNLKMIYLEGNNLKELPGAIFKTLKFLQWLDVRNNQLNCLPSDIKGHPHLETILIQRNKMERLPLELGTLPRLKRLLTAHNPLICPPNEILSLGSTEILKYLRDEWNKIHPEELIASPKVSEEIPPKPSMILCYQSKTNSKKPLKMPKKGSISKAPEKDSVRKKIWNYKPSNRCDGREVDESFEQRLLWIEKAKEFLEERASALQKLLDSSTLRNWRYDRSSFNKSMIKAANRTEDDIPFAVDPNSIALSMKKTQEKNKPSTKRTSNRRNRAFQEPITDINKNIDYIFESLDKLKATKTTENLSPKTEKKMLESEIQEIIDLQNSIKHLQKHNDMVTAPYAGKEISKKSYDFPPSMII